MRCFVDYTPDVDRILLRGAVVVRVCAQSLRVRECSSSNENGGLGCCGEWKKRVQLLGLGDELCGNHLSVTTRGCSERQSSPEEKREGASSRCGEGHARLLGGALEAEERTMGEQDVCRGTCVYSIGAAGERGRGGTVCNWSVARQRSWRCCGQRDSVWTGLWHRRHNHAGSNRVCPHSDTRRRVRCRLEQRINF